MKNGKEILLIMWGKKLIGFLLMLTVVSIILLYLFKILENSLNLPSDFFLVSWIGGIIISIFIIMRTAVKDYIAIKQDKQMKWFHRQKIIAFDIAQILEPQEIQIKKKVDRGIWILAGGEVILIMVQLYFFYNMYWSAFVISGIIQVIFIILWLKKYRKKEYKIQ
jgi:hypothetical protein